MENIKFIDITQLPEDLWQDAKNLIAIDSNGEVIKAEKQDSYSKDEIDDLLKDAEISADKLQNKIKINSASTDYVVTQPTVSGDSLVLTDSMSDKNQYHTLGYDKTAETTEIGQVIKYSRFNGEFDENGNQIISTNFDNNQNIPLDFSHITEDGDQIIIHYTGSFANNDYETGTRTEGDSFEATITYNRNTKQLNASDDANVTIYHFTRSDTSEYIFDPNNKHFDCYMLPDDAHLIWNIGNMSSPLYYRYNVSTQGKLFVGETTTTTQTSRLPQNKNEFFRYENGVKAYILTDKNTTFKTINGQQITGNGNIELATKDELNEKQNVIPDLYSIRSGAALGATALQSVPSEYATEQWVNEQGFLKEHQDISNLATKAELNAKQDVITDLETIRSGAALGATALQSVPSEYALKSEIPDISTKQDKLVSGSNIKTINGTSLLGSGNIEIKASSDNVPTLQTTPNGTKSNYIYSTISYTNPQYSVISDISNFITYSTDKVTIASYKRYWGQESSNSYQNWSINAATTSQAGLMSASDKTKLDGIDLSTKQDTLVSGTNIKTVNGTSLLGSGNITIEGGSGNVDLNDYYTKSETNALVNPKLSQVTLTQAEYDALSTKAENVLYIISDAEDIKFKTINGAQITGEGNIEVATKAELATKQDVINDLDSIRSGAAKGATALQSVPSGYATEQWVNEQGFLKEHQDISNLATKAELATKQDVINDLQTIRSGAAKGATALQSVPDTYALKSEIKTVNGISLIGSGNIEVAKEWIGTQAQYDALSTKDNNTTYYITE